MPYACWSLCVYLVARCWKLCKANLCSYIPVYWGVWWYWKPAVTSWYTTISILIKFRMRESQKFLWIIWSHMQSEKEAVLNCHVYEVKMFYIKLSIPCTYHYKNMYFHQLVHKIFCVRVGEDTCFWRCFVLCQLYHQWTDELWCLLHLSVFSMPKCLEIYVEVVSSLSAFAVFLGTALCLVGLPTLLVYLSMGCNWLFYLIIVSIRHVTVWFVTVRNIILRIWVKYQFNNMVSI
jgi:hypothetical protein